MNIIVVVIAILLVSVLVYILLKNIYPLTEGYGSFGRVNLGKCCPRGYKFSTASKQCIAVCDGCTMEAYGKLKLEFKKLPGASKKTLQSSYDCDENDSKNVYEYDKINRQYTREDLLDQDDYGEWDMNSDFFAASVSVSGPGVQAAEEGGNEAWAGISTDAVMAQLSSDTIDISSAQDPFFEEIPEAYYYTGESECVNDYNTYSSTFPNAGSLPDVSGLYEGGSLTTSPNCKGHWKLDMSDERFDYVKDNDERFAIPNWKIYNTDLAYTDSLLENSTGDDTFAEYFPKQLTMLQTIRDSIGNTDSPVYKKYDSYLTTAVTVDTTAAPDINASLTANRNEFCNSLGIIIAAGSNVSTTNLITNNNEYSYSTLCVNSGINGVNNVVWENLCDTNITVNTSDWSQEGFTGDPANNLLSLCNAVQKSIPYICKSSDTIPDRTFTFCPP